jgi:hypothetical protein
MAVNKRDSLVANIGKPLPQTPSVNLAPLPTTPP